VSFAESASQADTQSVCIISTSVGQHFNWHRASCDDSWIFHYFCNWL